MCGCAGQGAYADWLKTNSSKAPAANGSLARTSSKEGLPGQGVRVLKKLLWLLTDPFSACLQRPQLLQACQSLHSSFRVSLCQAVQGSCRRL